MLALHALTFVLLAQPAPLDPPLADRPAGYSHIIGKYDIQLSAAPTDVQVEEPITLRIRIIGSGPATGEPSRQYLHPLFLDTWKDDFYVQEISAQHRVERDRRAWQFTYRLKPRHASVDAIPGFKLVYYDPSIAGKKKYVTRFADPIKITVKPKPARLDIDVPPAAPDSFYQHAASVDVLARSAPPVELTGAGYAALLLGVPVACLVGLLIVYVSTRSRLGNRQRSRAAERALAGLHAGAELPWVIVCRYLRERLDFTAQDAMPREVRRLLKRRGFALVLCARSAAFLQACDAVRFTAGAHAEPHALVAEAAQLIQALEADPCLR